jgi:hypothetical protein
MKSLKGYETLLHISQKPMVYNYIEQLQFSDWP